MGLSIPSPHLPSLQMLRRHTRLPLAVIFTAEWGNTGCYFRVIERNLPDKEANLVKKKNSCHSSRAHVVPWSSAQVTCAAAPSCLVLLLPWQLPEPQLTRTRI